MQLTSSAFDHEQRIPDRYTCEGEDVSPALSWDGVPDGTSSLALVMDDPDAPPGTWVHWVLYDLPPETRALPESVPADETLADGGTHGACWGVDTFSRLGYHGPCPPPGSPHRYIFKLYALSRRLGLAPKATLDEVMAAMQGSILDETKLIGTYGR